MSFVYMIFSHHVLCNRCSGSVVLGKAVCIYIGICQYVYVCATLIQGGIQCLCVGTSLENQEAYAKCRLAAWYSYSYLEHTLQSDQAVDGCCEMSQFLFFWLKLRQEFKKKKLFQNVDVVNRVIFQACKRKPASTVKVNSELLSLQKLNWSSTGW